MIGMTTPKPAIPAGTWLTTAEVAQLLRVSDQTVAAYLRAGKLPQPIRIGRRLLFRATDIEAHLARLQGK